MDKIKAASVIRGRGYQQGFSVGLGEDPQKALAAYIKGIASDPRISPQKKRELYRQAAEAYMAIRASEGLTDTEMKRLVDKALGRINVQQRAADTGRLALLARSGIKADSGLGISTKARLDKGAAIAKGRAQVEAERLDEDIRNRAMNSLINMPSLPPKQSGLSKLLRGAGKAAAAFFVSGGNPVASAAAAVPELMKNQDVQGASGYKDLPFFDGSKKDLFYEDPYSGYA